MVLTNNTSYKLDPNVVHSAHGTVFKFLVPEQSPPVAASSRISRLPSYFYPTQKQTHCIQNQNIYWQYRILNASTCYTASTKVRRFKRYK
jgi:hypothetical protein